MEPHKLQSKVWLIALSPVVLFLWQRELGVCVFGMYLTVVNPNVYHDLTMLRANIGTLTARALPKLTTAYCTPRFVGFTQGGLQLIVAFMEQSLM